jgi:hypothetical protein
LRSSGDLVASVVREHDCFHTLGGGVGEGFDLPRHRVFGSWTGEDQFALVAQFGVSFLRALIRLVEDGDCRGTLAAGSCRYSSRVLP